MLALQFNAPALTPVGGKMTRGGQVLHVILAPDDVAKANSPKLGVPDVAPQGAYLQCQNLLSPGSLLSLRVLYMLVTVKDNQRTHTSFNFGIHARIVQNKSNQKFDQP